MRITLDDSLTGRGEVDLDVTRGTPLADVVTGLRSPTVWCGSLRLAPEHRAGTLPLVSGAVLSSVPRRERVDPRSLHLAAIAGPDAGVLIQVDSLTALGSARTEALLRDEACDAHHATLIPLRRGALVVRDEGSVNGTGVWARREGSLRWRGRRTRARLRPGDVIAVGRTLLEVRSGDVAEGNGAAAPGGRTGVRGVRRSWRVGAASAFRHATAVRRKVAAATPPWRVGRTLELEGWPDPTRVGSGAPKWDGPIAIRGLAADEVARGVILARGRRPPEPCLLSEPWLSWLPDPLPSDGPISFGAISPDAGVEGWVLLTTDADGMSSALRGVTTTGPAVRVREDTAQALVRSTAGSLPEPPPRMIGWAHAASLARQFAGPRSTRSEARAVVAGIHVEDQDLPWILEMGHESQLTLIAGATGSGKTTLMATIAGALAVQLAPHELRFIILCAGDAGPLGPHLRLPHVAGFATHVGPAEALSLLHQFHAREVFTVVIADDLDRLGPAGAAVTARLEALALEGDGATGHIVMATTRPAAVFTPSLRAAKGTAVALRTERPADSVEVIGVEAAVHLPRHSPGRALVRRSGRIDAVQVALPWADAVRVRPWDAPAQGVRSLAEAACTAPALTPPTRPASHGPTPPAS